MTKRKIIFGSLIVLVLIGIIWWWRSSTATAPDAAESSSPSSQASFDKTKYSTDDPNSLWVVVNKRRALRPADFEPADLVLVGNGQQLRAEAASAFQQLAAGARQQGLTVVPLSGFRSYATQQAVYNREVAAFGQARADTESARPGYSEHQTGLTIDVGGGGCNIEDCFGQTAEGKWVAANANKYGFIVRYTEASQPVTGYRPEPWHLRYVGVELAKELQRRDIPTLEQFFGL